MCAETYQVALAVPFVDEVTSVTATLFAHGVLLPAAVAGVVLLHQPCQEGDVDVFAGQAGRRAECRLQVVYQLFEPITLGDRSRSDTADSHACRLL